MELRQLQHFVAVAEEMSFSRGALRVQVVQSAVSTSVRRLERELNVELIDRSRRAISLTAAGESFLVEARHTLDAARRARAVAAEHRDHLTGTVDVGVLMNSGALDLPEVLGRFHAAHPLVVVRLRQDSAGSAGHLTAVANGTLDLALVAAQTTARPDLTLLPVASEPLVVLCRADHSLADRAHVAVAELSRETIVNFADGWGIRHLIDRAFAEAGVAADAPYEVCDYDTAAGLVRHGLGVSIMPATPGGKYDDLRCVPIEPMLEWTLNVATTIDPTAGAATQTMIHSILQGRAENSR